jgi:hypothetical protein
VWSFKQWLWNNPVIGTLLIVDVCVGAVFMWVFADAGNRHGVLVSAIAMILVGFVLALCEAWKRSVAQAKRWDDERTLGGNL